MVSSYPLGDETHDQPPLISEGYRWRGGRQKAEGGRRKDESTSRFPRGRGPAVERVAGVGGRRRPVRGVPRGRRPDALVARPPGERREHPEAPEGLRGQGRPRGRLPRMCADRLLRGPDPQVLGGATCGRREAGGRDLPEG